MSFKNVKLISLWIFLMNKICQIRYTEIINSFKLIWPTISHQADEPGN